MIAILVALVACVSTAEFTSLEVNKTGGHQTLKGKLTKPQGDGPFPALVLLHGCSGPLEHYSEWIVRLRRWGYVSLMVDSFGPRGESNICAPGQGMLISPSRRAKDAHGAKLYLAGLPFVDRNRIAVLGWSHGGMAVLEAVTMYHPFGGPFNAAIAYYPYCTQLSITNAPLLVLIGEKDDWTPADRCKALIFSEGSEPEIILKVYPDAHHAFDQPLRLNYYMGHMVGRDSSAASDSYNKVRAFLEKYLKDH